MRRLSSGNADPYPVKSSRAGLPRVAQGRHDLQDFRRRRLPNPESFRGSAKRLGFSSQTATLRSLEMRKGRNALNAEAIPVTVET